VDPVLLGGECRYGSTCSNVPVTVESDARFGSLALATAWSYTCGITSEMRTYCWRGFEWRLPGAPTLQPPSLSTDLEFTQLAAGYHHVCGITTDGSAYCWGANDRMQLGAGWTEEVYWVETLEPVTGGNTFAAVTAGWWHSCALTPEGEAYCWGANDRGQLGVGAAATDSGWQACRYRGTCATEPMPVQLGLRFRSLSAGDNHTCGVSLENIVYCWGQNEQWQVGSPHAADTCWAVPYDDHGWWQVACSRHPVAVQGPRFTDVAAGSAHTCALTEDGEAYCWGPDPLPAKVLGSSKRFTAITAGSGFTCGIDVEGYAYCWGDNEYGQLGDGSMEDSPVPVRVRSPRPTPEPPTFPREDPP